MTHPRLRKMPRDHPSTGEHVAPLHVPAAVASRPGFSIDQFFVAGFRWTWEFWYIGWNSKNRGFSPKMDGENNRKPYLNG